MTFQDRGRTVACPEGGTILDCALLCELDISHICGGEGSCGTCRVEVLAGWDRLSPQTPDETSREIEAPYRLACQTRIHEDVVVRIAAID